jgi:hypothetical protein
MVAVVAIAVIGLFGDRFGNSHTNVVPATPTLAPNTTGGPPIAPPNALRGELAKAPSTVADQSSPGFPLPSVYGIYAISNGELHELEALPGRAPDQRIFMSAVMTNASRTTIPDGRLSFVAFRRELATNAPARVSVRVIAKIMRAMTFDQAGKSHVTSVNDAWAIRNVAHEFRVAPLEDNSEMLVMRPESPNFVLPAGRYALVLNGIAYDFEVAGPVTEPVHCLERVAAANGTFYSECRKP